MSAHYWFRFALNQFNAVREHQIRVHSSDPRWHTTALDSVPPTSRRPGNGGGLTVVDLQPFGREAQLFANSTAVSRLKILELACYLTMHADGVPRDEIPQRLYPDSDQRRAGNHFRQVVHQLRKSTGLTLQRLPDTKIAWSGAIKIDSADARFENVVADAWQSSGAERLRKLELALNVVRGPYLAASDLDWATERRNELQIVHEEALVEAAKLAVRDRQTDKARHYANLGIELNPYAESAYRSLIEAAAIDGSTAAALAAYRQLREAMRSLGLEPSAATLAALRRIPG
jgi:DNA-binding SARP family transcriptional activator